MTRGEIALDSYRLAQYATPLPCFICDEPNPFDAELCRKCFAPLALSHQSSGPKTQPKMIATIGSSGVGKTVYLGVLMDMISRRSNTLQLLARGAFSVNLQQKTISALALGEFPEKTPNEPDRWNWVHCQITGAKPSKAVELIMPDMAGEALLEEVDHPQTYHVVNAFLSKCAGAVVLIDATQLYEGRCEEDYFTMKLLSYLSELVDDEKLGWANRPVAIVFSKADQCDVAFDDPHEFARRHAEGLWRHCQRFRQHRYFAASVPGNCAWRKCAYDGRVQAPLRVEPRGIIEPFEWLVEQVAGKALARRR